MLNKTIEISGAGPAGLAAALAVVKTGRAACVYERRDDVGKRYAHSQTMTRPVMRKSGSSACVPFTRRRQPTAGFMTAWVIAVMRQRYETSRKAVISVSGCKALMPPVCGTWYHTVASRRYKPLLQVHEDCDCTWCRCKRHMKAAADESAGI